MLIPSFMILRESHLIISKKISSESGENQEKLNHLIEEDLLDSLEEEMMIGIKEVQETSTIDHLTLIGSKIRETMAISNHLQTNLVIREKITKRAGIRMTEGNKDPILTISHISMIFLNKDSPNKI